MSESPRHRILFLTPQTPHRARQGAAIRNWNVMAQLARRHDLDLLTFVAEGEEGDALQSQADEPWQTIFRAPAPRRSWRRRLQVLALSGRADMADRLWSPAFARRLRELLTTRRYDIVQGEGIELGRYLLTLQGPAATRPLLVFDDHNAEYVLQQRAASTDLHHPARWVTATYSLLQWQRLRRFERRLLKACDLTLCVSEYDAAALQVLAPERPLIVAPNGVDTTYYMPDLVTKSLPRFDLVFSGTLDYRPNIDALTWFVNEVWPGLRARRHDLRLALVGRNPAPEITQLVRHGGVVVTGSVADDRPYFSGASVYIVPMRYGGGVRLKLLNALAMGCAIVSTTSGCEGLAVRDGEHLLVADGEERFAAAIVRLLDNPDLRARLGAAGRAFVQEHYDWASIVARLEAGYEAAFKIRSSPPVVAPPPTSQPNPAPAVGPAASAPSEPAADKPSLEADAPDR